MRKIGEDRAGRTLQLEVEEPPEYQERRETNKKPRLKSLDTFRG